MKAMFDALLPRLRALPGEISFFAKDTVTGESLSFQPELPLIAASVIKLPVLAEAFRQAEAGLLSMEDTVSIDPSMKMPSCGALTYLHDGLTVTVRDLCTLMIILSDNTATNLLIDRVGIENVNQLLRKMGFAGTTLRRKLFDREASQKGLQNHMTAGEMGGLLERLLEGKCVSPEADREMLSILLNQRLNGKIPFFLHSYYPEIKIAHKTGEDDGITHDVGIVFASHPLILCFASNHTDVPAFERLMQDGALMLVQAIQGK